MFALDFAKALWARKKAELGKEMETASPLRKAFVALDELAIAIGITILIVAIIFGDIAMPIFNNTSTANWNATTVTIWVVIPIVSLAVLVIGLIKYIQHER